MLTVATSTPSAWATASRMAGICSASLGRWRTIVASTFDARHPASRSSDAVRSSNAMLDTPFGTDGSFGGKCEPMSPSAAAPSSASMMAWAAMSPSLWPSSPRSDGTGTPPSTSGAPSISRCASYPMPKRVVMGALQWPLPFRT